MIQIQLTQGQVATIDDVDGDLAAFQWFAQKSRKTFYACRRLPRSNGKQPAERLHRVIARRMGIIGNPDHKDRDGLNNRRDNLRQASDGQNNANQDLRADSTSGLKGVCFHEAAGKWRARIAVNGKRRSLGLFDEAIEAAKAYDAAALAAFGEFAVLNFPQARPAADSFFGIDLQVADPRLAGTFIDCSGGSLTPEIVEDAFQRIINAPPPIPCGMEGNPHLVHPRPAGEITYCIQCGYMAVLMEEGGYRKLNAEEQQKVDDAFKRALEWGLSGRKRRKRRSL